MSESILVPVLGESVTEATVAKWLKNEGDKVSADEAIVELETDKVNVEVPAPLSGTLEKISVKEGQTVNVGGLLGTMSNSSSAVTGISTKEEKEDSPPPKKLEVIKKVEAIKKVEVTKEEEQTKKEEPLVEEAVLETSVVDEASSEEALEPIKDESVEASSDASSEKKETDKDKK